MNTETIRTLNHEENTVTNVRPCILFDDRCCGNCKYYNSVYGTCGNEYRAPSSWCKNFAYA